MCRKQVIIVVGGAFLAALILGYVSLSGPHGKIIARLQQKDSGGFIHSVTVRQFAGRFNTELSDEGRPVRDLPVSSYEFYEGSDPITSATILWPELHRFSISFNNGETVECSWGESNVVWAVHYVATNKSP
jgi:hypothetical protein